MLVTLQVKLLIFKLSGSSTMLNQVLFVIKHSYPSLRVAYIDEVEERDGDKVQKVYYSVLVKAVENRDQVRQKI
jgi:hypothetical protein